MGRMSFPRQQKAAKAGALHPNLLILLEESTIDL